ncbi:DUF1659 domain-containing protein [Anaerobacillus sp. CMMVII]|uniref:DUF1659 domain-containing protein n=1 Tax=Anaerobacillus sp. CMMVII TaxID=2755588 RepID=UPI0021B6EA12|nr:DUF1659 domain-containing protein [Anaerobacillus sp. CMMVII]MCT8137565.1 DUF1659 domain-containing protein [Anaerobacillus sp. CMMVII]
MENILQTRLTLHFYGGVDGEGKEIFKTKTFPNVDNTATSEQLKRAAQALASLQTVHPRNDHTKQSVQYLQLI